MAEQQIPVLKISKTVHVSACHKLWAIELSESQNRSAYGDGMRLHGHTYAITCVFQGHLCTATGKLMDDQLLNDSMKVAITEFLEKRNLDTDITFFVSPTAIDDGEPLVEVDSGDPFCGKVSFEGTHVPYTPSPVPATYQDLVRQKHAQLHSIMNGPLPQVLTSTAGSIPGSTSEEWMNVESLLQNARTMPMTSNGL